MKYGLGLDIGISSVGSAVIELDENNEPIKIHKLCARVFERAEVKDTGDSLAANRREKRSMRRRLRRKRHRKERIRALILERTGMEEAGLDELYTSGHISDIYEIRRDALDKLLTREEWLRLLIHLSQRRGFRSNRKADANADPSSDEGALLSAVQANHKLMSEKSYRTVGEMLYLDPQFIEHKRNKGGNYTNTILRSDYANEIKLIFSSQRALGNPLADEDFEKKYTEIMMSQRSFDEGPGGDGPYSGNQIIKMLRKCTFEPEEYRAAKGSFSFEYFTLLSKINSVRVCTDSVKRPLTPEERKSIIDLSFRQKEVNYLSLRKLLGLDDSEYFNISYSMPAKSKKKNKNSTNSPEETISDAENKKATEKKTKFTFLNAYHTFKKAFGDDFDSWEISKRNRLAFILTVYKTDDSIRAELTKEGFNEDEIAKSLTVPSMKKFGNLSCTAMDKMIPYLEEGALYNEAAEKAGYNFKADDRCASMFLPTRAYIPPEHTNGKEQIAAPELDDITNPVVRRSVSQTIKVINAHIREMGESPVFVNIELARELTRSFDEREKIRKTNESNHSKNNAVMDELREVFRLKNPTGQDLIKLKLWKEQNEICLYSGSKIKRERLFEPGYAEIDHIIPYSISFDDSFNNKALVLAKENRDKGSSLPLQYMDKEKADQFRVTVANSTLHYRKKQNLLKEKLSDDDFEGFKRRNLQDTQYIARFMYNFIRKYLRFAGEPKVKCVNGAATAYIRKRWGISKIRADGDSHHAVDACVIACTTQGMIQRISQYAKYRESGYKGKKTCEPTVTDESGRIFDIDRRTGEVSDRFPLPYPTFRTELEMLTSNDPMRLLGELYLPNYSGDEQLKPIFVSRMPKHKVTAAAHKETVRGIIERDGKKYKVQKVDLKSLKLDKITGKNSEYYNPDDDRLLYNALKERLRAFGGDGEKAFAEPFYKPKSDGTDGPLVKKVKTVQEATLYVDVNRKTAVADNDTMIRADVFYVQGDGYYLVPVYEADTVKRELPHKAIVAHKPPEQWKEMKEEDFVFSLYPNDLIRISATKEMEFSLCNKNSTLPPKHRAKAEWLYYKGTGIANGTISVINHDNTYKIDSLGVKRIPLIEKYTVDVLGNISKVKKEKRMGF